MASKQEIDLETLYGILFENKKLTLTDDDLKTVDRSFQFLKDFSKDKIIYGINTGFGPMAQYRVD
ncbi:MAG: aromatic amino acid lyase, partial [Salinivirgaceae bacterium]|nr:aromatic amino acid lyase [Salinivirgaceae bacterium]